MSQSESESCSDFEPAVLHEEWVAFLPDAYAQFVREKLRDVPKTRRVRRKKQKQPRTEAEAEAGAEAADQSTPKFQLASLNNHFHGLECIARYTHQYVSGHGHGQVVEDKQGSASSSENVADPRFRFVQDVNAAVQVEADQLTSLEELAQPPDESAPEQPQQAPDQSAANEHVVKVELSVNSQREVAAEPKPDLPELKPESSLEPQPESSEPKPESSLDPTPESSLEPTPESSPEPKAGSSLEPKATSSLEPNASSGPEPKKRPAPPKTAPPAHLLNTPPPAAPLNKATGVPFGYIFIEKDILAYKQPTPVPPETRPRPPPESI